MLALRLECPQKPRGEVVTVDAADKWSTLTSQCPTRCSLLVLLSALQPLWGEGHMGSLTPLHPS